MDLSFYYDLTEQLRSRKIKNEKEDFIYFGDQGLLSAAFIGNMKHYGYMQDSGGAWYCPYNFCLGYYDYFACKPDYQPVIVHFAGVPFKPWKANYPIFPKRFKTEGGTLRELSELKPVQLEYYFLWLEYLFLTDKVLTIMGF